MRILVFKTHNKRVLTKVRCYNNDKNSTCESTPLKFTLSFIVSIYVSPVLFNVCLYDYPSEESVGVLVDW